MKSIYLDDLNHKHKVFMLLENLNIPLTSYSDIIYELGLYKNPDIEAGRLESQIKELRKFVAQHALFPYVQAKSAFYEDEDDDDNYMDF